MGFTKTELDPKAPYIECMVPRGVIIKKDDGEHVLNVVKMRELRGHEEDVLTNDKVDITIRLHQILSNCLVSVSDRGENVIDAPNELKKLLSSHPRGLLMSDTLVLLFRLREVTVGDEYRQKVVCPKCTTNDGDPYSWTHIGSMADLEIIPATGDLSQYRRSYTTTRGNVIEWDMLTAAREAELSKNKLSKDKATRSLLMRVVTINGAVATMDALKDLSFVERQEIREQFDSEGGMKTDLQMACRNCGHEFTVGLDIDARDFFNPSGTSKS